MEYQLIMKPVFFLDLDGCLASQGKIWRHQKDGTLTVSKVISDHDSWAIDALRDKAHIVIISGDRRINEAWAKRRKVPFIFTASDGFHASKWNHLYQYWLQNFTDLPEGNYFYLGDSMPDFTCMVNAKLAFYPKDACLTLKRYAEPHGNITELGTKSGEGTFEAMIDVLIQAELLSGDLL